MEILPAAQFLTLRLIQSAATEVICVDLDGPGHAPPYLCVRRRIMKYVLVVLAISFLYFIGYLAVRSKYDNGPPRPIGPAGSVGPQGNFPGLSFWYGGRFDTILFYLYYPVIIIDGKITGINYIYTKEHGQIVQWNTK